MAISRDIGDRYSIADTFRRMGRSKRKSNLPSRRVYPWRGYIEAADFDPPEIVGYSCDAERGELRVRAEDSSGVAYVRLAYSRGGEPRMRDLRLVKGNKEEGEWRTGLLRGSIKDIALIAADELYNWGKWRVEL